MQTPHTRTALALLVLALTLLTSCGADREVMSMLPIPVPEGGAVTSLATMSSPAGKFVIAPTDLSLFVHDGEGWESVEAQLLPRFQLAPLAAFRYEAGEFTYPREQSFVGFGERLWMVTHPGAVQQPQLWVSGDTGRTWSAVTIPAGPEESQNLVADPLRILVSEDELYIVQAQSISRLNSKSPGEIVWEPVYLTGIKFSLGAEAQVPSLIRNYLPASPDRPFELVSVLSDQLRIYRRTEVGEPWVLTSVQGAVDRQLLGVPGRRTVLFVHSGGVYRSEDDGEMWNAFWPDGQPDVEVVQSFSTAEGGDYSLAGCLDGSIWRSTDGMKWIRVRGADSDYREVTALAEVGPGEIWASTMGQGVSRSLDSGVTWAPFNQGLRAARPLDMDVLAGSAVLMATEAGLFRSLGELTEGEWEMVHARATGAVDTTGDTLISGTVTGEILAGPIDGTSPELQPLPLPDELGPLFSPQRHRHRRLPPQAIVDISTDSNLWVVWTRQHGFFTSRDQGQLWEEAPLSEALLATLRASSITRFLSTPNETFYLAEHSERLATPTQLWRSRDLGESWTAVHSFPKPDSGDTRVILKRVTKEDPDHLVAALRDGVWESLDGGASWVLLKGDWSRVVDMSILDGRLVVFGLTASGTAQIHLIADLNGNRDRRVFDLSWPEGVTDTPATLEAQLTLEHVYVSTKRGVFVGKLPTGREEYGEGFFGLIGVLLLLVASSIGFGVLRWIAR